MDLATGKKDDLPRPKAKPRDPWTAEDLEEFRNLWLEKFGRVAGSREQLDFLESHPGEQEERDSDLEGEER